MRDFSNFNGYLTELAGDIYPQPRDSGHDEKTSRLLLGWLSNIHLSPNAKRNVLDLGCGQGNAAEIFDAFGWAWTGITMGEDYNVCKQNGLNVYPCDFSFLDNVPDSSFDLLFARHALEHSPAPLLTLFEWHRVAKQFMILVLPSVEKELVAGLNHYALLYKVQWEALLYRAGWKVIWEDTTDPAEYRLMCLKVARLPAPYDYTAFAATVEKEGTDLRK